MQLTGSRPPAHLRNGGDDGEHQPTDDSPTAAELPTSGRSLFTALTWDDLCRMPSIVFAMTDQP